MKKKNKTHFVESANYVPCPLRIQSQMLCNLKESSRSKINRQRAKRAAEILAAIEAESKLATIKSQSSQMPEKAPVSIDIPQAVLPAAEVSRPRLISATFRKIVERILSFVRQHFFLRPVRSA